MTDKTIKTTLLTSALVGSMAMATLVAINPSGVSAASNVAPGASPIGNYLAGRHAEAERDLSVAADFLKAALAEAPDAPDLLRRTFVILTMEGRIEEASRLGKIYIRENPKSSIANLVLAVDEFKRGQSGAAAKRLSALPDTGLSGLMVPPLHAWVLAGQKKFDAAITALGALDGKKGAQHLYDLHKGLIQEFSGKHREALATLEKINADKTPMNFRYVELLGNIYERAGNGEKATALYKRYMSENPSSTLLESALARIKAGKKPKAMIRSAEDGAAEALFGISNSLRQQRARETALVLGRMAMYLKPDYPIMLILAGDLMEMDNRPQDANTFYARVPENTSFGRTAILRTAANLHEMKQTDEAIKLLRKVSKANPKDPEPPTKIGDYFRSQERYAEAIPEYDEAIRRAGELKPQHWRLLYIRGIVLEREKKWAKAEKDFLKALEFKPNQPYVLNYLGYSWVEQRLNLEKALDMIRKAIKIRPNDGYIIDSLGWGYYMLGRYDDAVSELERAVEYRPEDPVINDHLGDAYWRVGRRLEAEFQWKRSLSLKPDAELIESVNEKLRNGLKNEETATPSGDGKTPNKG